MRRHRTVFMWIFIQVQMSSRVRFLKCCLQSWDFDLWVAEGESERGVMSSYFADNSFKSVNWLLIPDQQIGVSGNAEHFM